MKKKIKIGIILLSFMLVISMFLFVIKFIDSALDIKFTLNGNNNITIMYGEDYSIEDYKFTYRGEATTCEEIYNDLDVEKLGNYKIMYICKLGNYYKKVTRYIDVIDEEKPTIEAEDLVYFSVNDSFKPEYKATDNYDGDITAKVKVSTNIDMSTKGEYQIVYTVNDSSGNETTKTSIAKVTDKFEHTYIKVSINEQKIRYYEYNKLVFESDVVTGFNNATKVGSYKVQKKVRNTILAGKNYRSYVKYWIQYNGKYGLHDASWRNKFGGTIYKSSGSHGCVNLPDATAEYLYSKAEIGMPVYIN